MKKITLKAGLLLAAGLLSMAAHAQNQPKKIKKNAKPVEMLPCGTTQYEQMVQSTAKGNKAEKFEQWIAQKIAAKKVAKALDASDEILTIPIVVHVVHNGDAVGINENISETQVLSQIEVLNQDYRRAAGTPGFNNNPVGADLQIQFCLARRTPGGENTTGIVRHNIEHDGGWSLDDATEILKPSTQWDPEQYLNIWVVDNVYYEVFGFQVELGGYATFPEQSGLEGLGDIGPANQEGIVIGHRYFGSKELFPEGTFDETRTRDRGRSASHEIGHYLGLRHIWGDANNCETDDYCADTPVAAQPNQECAEGTDSCPEHDGLDMIENYMDYTPDACMNTFTQDQKARMMAVLQNSPRRVNLLTSPACTPAEVYDNDGSLNIMNINLTDCSNTFSPSVKLTNTGNSTMTSAAISYDVNGTNDAVYNWTGSLAPDESTIVNFTEIAAISGTNMFNVALTSVNGSADAYAENDAKTVAVKVNTNVTTEQITITIQPDIYGSETVWALIDSDDEVVVTGGPYEDSEDEETLGELVTETVTLESGKCYMFAIYDVVADGMCCEYGEGFYKLSDGNGNVFAQGGSFGTLETVNFGVNMALSTPATPAPLAGVTLYPNPANSIINIATPQSVNRPDAYAVFNSLGQMVAQGKISTQNQEINISGYANGVYFIKVSDANSSKTLKFIKN